MGDRNTPIKFGPEWLRNLSLERNAGNNNPNQSSPSNFTNPANSPGATAGPSSGNTASGSSSSNPNSSISQSPSTKVLLAKQRFGREEMLALYDKDADAPPELKQIDILYQARGKPPIALNNTFEDEMRDNMRSSPSTSGMASGERFNMGRGGGRGIIDGRGRARVPFIRQLSNVRGGGSGGGSWHHSNPRMPIFSGGPDEESTLNVRSSWNNNNGGGNAVSPNTGDPHWNKMFRSKRQGTPSNWRQSREEGEEWRSPDGARPRVNQQDQNKWERDWGDRPHDKQQSWGSNRRTWVGGDTHNSDDNLPEWAMDNAEACGGTFDSSGAFHGYSNDDTNLPKNQEGSFPLIRSHTHGSFAVSKSTDDGSDEWWASDKAKKLSPKRFDASDIKFKKQISSDGLESGLDSKASTSKEESHHHDMSDKIESSKSSVDHDSVGGCDDDKAKKNTYQSKFSRLESMEMLSDMSFGEAGDEAKGNFQSVIIITPNNILRQKHQNIVSATSEVSKSYENNINRDGQGILQLLQNSTPILDNDMRKHQSPEDKIVDDIIFDITLDDKETTMKHQQIASPLTHSSANISSAMSSMVNSPPQLSNPNIQLRLSSPAYPNQGLINPKQPMPSSGIPVGMPSGMQGLPAGLQVGIPLQAGLQIGGLPPSLQQLQPLSMQQSAMQVGGNQQSGMGGSLQPSSMHQSPMQGNIPTPGMQGGLQNSGMQSSLQSNVQSPLQNIGIPNSALNASLGLPIVNNAMGMSMPGVPPVVLGSSGIGNSNMGGSNIQSGMSSGMQASNSGIPGFPTGGITGISNTNVPNSSLFMGQNTNNSPMGNPSNNNIGIASQTGQSNIFPMHGLQHSSSQTAFGSSIYSNIMQSPSSQSQSSPQSLNDQWYYEDPAKNIQGPFTAKDMYNWYRAGFFSPNLMVRRACDTHMRPLGSYGPIVPFAQRDMLSSFSMSGGFDRPAGPHESMLNSQQTLGLDSVLNIQNLNDASSMDSIQFGTVGHFPPQQSMVDSLWSQPSSEHWLQHALSGRNESRVNNLFFWDQQPSNLTPSSMLPEDITKDMKTEDEILAQLRASQNAEPATPYLNEQPVSSPSNKPEEKFSSTPSATPNLEELQKLIQKDSLLAKPSIEPISDYVEVQPNPEGLSNIEPSNESKTAQGKAGVDVKQAKSPKTETEKVTKNKDTKPKNKKKEDKKDDLESKIKEEDIVKPEKRSEEMSPSKNKKEDKVNKKELEKEKKEWLKDGFTIVKGTEKNLNKDSKKKVEEAKIAEEVERRKKEEERLAAEEDRKRKLAESLKKQELQQQKNQLRQSAESAAKKAPWSVTAPSMAATVKDGLTLAEIQRLEREKKLEQMKEQQQMMQIIAQQQAAALAREQEIQAGLGWAKNKAPSFNAPGQSFTEIQAETRKQAAAAAAAAAAVAAVTQALDQGLPPPILSVPWANAPNGGGFWDTQPNQPSKAEKVQESPKATEVKTKKKPQPVSVVPPKKETSPAAEFDTWCNTVLASWSSKIDVPTFVGFLKDIESPYEVKDYVKYYLGESKESNDFARHFLERRSKLLRASTVTPSDDLCSPAIAVNPRTASSSDYQEVKNKGRKTKKNKMLKVDARILGFSVTASEDRINVGDIDTV